MAAIVPSLDYYLGIVTSEYRQSPRFIAWLTEVLQIIEDARACLDSMGSAFDLDLAIGAQLDILGAIAGVSRTVSFQPTGSVSPVLDDASYRLLIKATIANNQWDGRIGSLYPIWRSLFPSGNITVVDNQNMSCTILLSGTFTSILQDLIENGYIVPRPQAVEYTYVFSTLPVFGFDSNSAYVAGFDSGHWA